MVESARIVGKFQLERRATLHVDRTKEHSNDFVTDIDVASERMIVERVRALFPQDRILGEEGGEQGGAGDWQWIIDPIDGTRNFMSGTGPWCVSIGLTDGADAIVGVVHEPVSGDTYSAIRGEGSELNGSPVRVSDLGDVDNALIGFSFNPSVEVKQRSADLIHAVLPAIGDVRRLPAAIHLAYGAAGQLDGGVLLDVKDWDIAAGLLIAAEAGARIDHRATVTGSHSIPCES
jgi:myo-inositol-1(or 4)-monophosphatase